MAPIVVAPWIDDIVLGSAQDAMRLVGAIAILAGLTVAVLSVQDDDARPD